MRGNSLSGRYFLVLLICSSLFWMSGCVSVETSSTTSDKVFYPEPPELPRIQFLHSYVGASDFAEEQTAFDAFVTGKKSAGLRLDKPYGVAAQKGKIYVADSNSTVMEFDFDKKSFERLQGAKGLGKLVQPLNIAMDENGNKFVTDPVRKQVLQYDQNDFYVQSFRLGGDWKPVDVEVSGNNLFVADPENKEIQVFDIEHNKYLQSIGQEGLPENRLGMPLNLAIGPDGYLYIVDGGRFQIVVYDRDGHFIKTIGEAGQTPGRFARPRGIAIDKNGIIYVVDAAFNYVQVFHNSGQLLTFFGGPGEGPGNLHLPAAVVLDYQNADVFKGYVDDNFTVDYLIIVTSQFGDRLVNVYAYGKQKGAKYPDLDKLREIRQKQYEEMKDLM